MILRAAIIFMLMLNLGVAAWWLAGAGHAVTISAPVIDDSQPGLRLVNEPIAAKLIGPPAMPAAPSVAANPAPVEQPATPPAPVPATALCLSFGPFEDAAARDAVRPRLQVLAAKLVSRDAPARSARGWRVYMPPLATREAAQELAGKITAAGIKDLYIINTSSEANSIALGRYGGEESARRRQAELTGKGFDARAEPLADTPPQWWLDGRFPVDVSRAALAAIATAGPLDCARLQ